LFIRKIFLFVALAFLALTCIVVIFRPSETGKITETFRIEETTIPTTTTLESTTTSTTQETTTTSEITTSTSTTTITVPPADHVVFSEVFYDTPGTETAEEWIELYNPTSDYIDLSGLTIEDNKDSYLIPNGTIIADKEYLVIARNETGFENLYGFLPDLSGLGLKLANGGDEIRLKDGSEEIDMVAWGNYVDGWDLEAEEGESIQKDPSYKDTDTDDDWIINTNPDPEPGGLITSTTTSTSTTSITTSSTTTTEATTTSTTVTTTSTTTTIEESTTTTISTSTTTTTIPVTADVVINEVLYDPNETDTGKEWIELYNKGDSDENMMGYCLYASGEHYVFGEFTLTSGSFVVVHWNKDGTDNSKDVYTGTTGWDNIGNTKGSVVLFNTHTTHTQDTIIDFIQYGNVSQTWESAAVSAGIWTENDFISDVEEEHSIARYAPGQDTNSPDDFYDESSPSPGQQNE